MTVNTYGFGHVQNSLLFQTRWVDTYLWAGHVVGTCVTNNFMRAGIQLDYRMWGLR